MLPADVPDLEVHVRQANSRHILTHRRDGFLGRRGRRGEVEGFDGGEEGGFARVVKAEEEDRVLYAYAV